MTEQQKQARRFIDYLIKTCWENPGFKKKLIEDPIGTIEKITGRPSRLPNGFRIEVEDQSDPSKIYLNIPSRPGNSAKTT